MLLSVISKLNMLIITTSLKAFGSTPQLGSKRILKSLRMMIKRIKFIRETAPNKLS